MYRYTLIEFKKERNEIMFLKPFDIPRSIVASMQIFVLIQIMGQMLKVFISLLNWEDGQLKDKSRIMTVISVHHFF